MENQWNQVLKIDDRFPHTQWFKYSLDVLGLLVMTNIYLTYTSIHHINWIANTKLKESRSKGEHVTSKLIYGAIHLFFKKLTLNVFVKTEIKTGLIEVKL